MHRVMALYTVNTEWWRYNHKVRTEWWPYIRYAQNDCPLYGTHRMMALYTVRTKWRRYNYTVRADWWRIPLVLFSLHERTRRACLLCLKLASRLACNGQRSGEQLRLVPPMAETGEEDSGMEPVRSGAAVGEKNIQFTHRLTHEHNS